MHVFLTSALVGGEWSASRPCRFTLRERYPDIQWIGARFGRRGKEQILDPTGTRSPARTQSYTECSKYFLKQCDKHLLDPERR
jgi:hypothetical protein